MPPASAALRHRCGCCRYADTGDGWVLAIARLPPRRWPYLRLYAARLRQKERGSGMTVHFIGAGPGAPDLITLRGLRLIESCPVCLYAGSLVP
ncbi:MAG: SAM-dependent methyltransferase, partial [Arenimonas sp.]